MSETTQGRTRALIRRLWMATARHKPCVCRWCSPRQNVGVRDD